MLQNEYKKYIIKNNITKIIIKISKNFNKIIEKSEQFWYNTYMIFQKGFRKIKLMRYWRYFV